VRAKLFLRLYRGYFGRDFSAKASMSLPKARGLLDRYARRCLGAERHGAVIANYLQEYRMMDDFKLAKNDEDSRKSLFPDLTPRQFQIRRLLKCAISDRARLTVKERANMFHEATRLHVEGRGAIAAMVANALNAPFYVTECGNFYISDHRVTDYSEPDKTRDILFVRQYFEGECMTSGEVRELAAHLIRAADLHDRRLARKPAP
jgi:hypothetical protein